MPPPESVSSCPTCRRLLHIPCDTHAFGAYGLLVFVCMLFVLFLLEDTCWCGRCGVVLVVAVFVRSVRLVSPVVLYFTCTPCHRPLLEAGVCDFAVFDACRDREVALLHSGVTLREGEVDVPILVVASYVFDSLPADIFKVTASTSKTDEAETAAPTVCVQQGRVPARSADATAVKRLSFGDVVEGDPSAPLLQCLREQGHSGLVLVPTVALRMISNMRRLQVRASVSLCAVWFVSVMVAFPSHCFFLQCADTPLVLLMADKTLGMGDQGAFVSPSGHLQVWSSRFCHVVVHVRPCLKHVSCVTSAPAFSAARATH